jgi:hypothetical protein
MRKKAAITTGVAAAVLSGGLALALNGGGTASAARTAAGASAAPARPTASPSVTKISRSEAEQIALAAVPGGRVTSAELESEHGVPVWSVRVSKGGVRHDLDINAYTGKVIRDDDARPATPDRGREAEHRHGEAEPGDDHGRHGGGEDHHGGGDSGHRGRH